MCRSQLSWLIWIHHSSASKTDPVTQRAGSSPECMCLYNVEWKRTNIQKQSCWPRPWGSSSRQAFTYLLRSWTIWSFADNGFMALHRVCLRFLPQLEEQESSGCAAESVHESGSMTHRFVVNVSKTIMTLLPTAIKLTSLPIGVFFVFFVFYPHTQIPEMCTSCRILSAAASAGPAVKKTFDSSFLFHQSFHSCWGDLLCAWMLIWSSSQ